MPFFDVTHNLPEASRYALNNQRKKLAALLANGLDLASLGPGDHPEFPVDPLSVAARMGYTGIVQDLLTAGAQPVAHLTDVAHVDIARLLRTHRNWPATGEALNACLQRAARDGHALMVKHWLREGAPVDTMDAQGRTPLQNLALLFSPRSARKEELERGWKTLGALLDAQADVDRADPRGMTPLLALMRPNVTASDQRFQLGAVQLLLERGANPNVMSAGGSALWMALGGFGPEGLARLLVVHGGLILPPARGTGTPDTGVGAPETVMLRAVRSRNPAMVEVALAQGADLMAAGTVPGVEVFDGRAVTPLMLATQMAWNDGIHALLDAFRHERGDLGMEMQRSGWQESPLAESPIHGSLEALVLLRTAKQPDARGTPGVRPRP